MSLTPMIPAEPTPTPGEMSTRPGPAGGSGHGVADALEPSHGERQQLPQHGEFFDRTAQGLRLVYVVGESGDEVWFAVCDRHDVPSIGGDRTLAAQAVCIVCEAEREAQTRRARFIRTYGAVVFSALFGASRG